MPNPNLPINFRKNTYIGARYVPKFSDTPGSEWDNSIQYEPLTIVVYQGNSYTSKTFVPVGVDINNDTYWAVTGNYNVQVEAYRQEVLNMQSSLNDLTAIVDNIKPNIIYKNILSYGVINDGITDTTQSFLKALKEYKYLYLPPGTYLVSQDLVLNGHSLIGTPDSVIKRASNSLTNYFVLNLEGANTHILNLSIQGDKLTHTGDAGEWGHGIYIAGDKCRVIGCKITECWGDGIYIENNNAYIENCIIDNNSRNGISVVKGSNFYINNCRISNTNRTAPMCAIDIEPNLTTDRVSGFINNILSQNNGSGFIAMNMKKSNNYFAFEISNCISQNDGQLLSQNPKAIGLIRVNTSDDTYNASINLTNISFSNPYITPLALNINTYCIVSTKNIYMTGGSASYALLMQGTRNNNCIEFTASYFSPTISYICNETGSTLMTVMKKIGGAKPILSGTSGILNLELSLRNKSYALVEYNQST